MEIKKEWVTLSHDAQRAQIEACAKDDPFALTLNNCGLDPVIFKLSAIVSLTLDRCTLTRDMWVNVNAWPSLLIAVFTNCTAHHWPSVLDALPSALEQLNLEHVLGGFNGASLTRFYALRSLVCKDFDAQPMVRTLLYKDSSTAEKMGVRSLASLTLDKCRLRTPDLAAIACLHNLTHLSLADNSFVSDANGSVQCMASLTKLTSLSLNNCMLKEQCGINLAYALMCMKALRKLYIAHNIGIRTVGMTYILNVLADNKNMETINVEHKRFEKSQHVRVDYKVWRFLDSRSKEWIADNCRPLPNCEVKKGDQVTCYECYHNREKHARTCKACREGAPCEEMRNAGKCTHSNDCAICMCPFDGAVMELGCHHVFCRSCLLEWTKKQKNCPTCREAIVLN